MNHANMRTGVPEGVIRMHYKVQQAKAVVRLTAQRDLQLTRGMGDCQLLEQMWLRYETP